MTEIYAAGPVYRSYTVPENFPEIVGPSVSDAVFETVEKEITSVVGHRNWKVEYIRQGQGVNEIWNIVIDVPWGQIYAGPGSVIVRGDGDPSVSNPKALQAMGLKKIVI